jgi:hypothetical protein
MISHGYHHFLHENDRKKVYLPVSGQTDMRQNSTAEYVPSK